LERELEEFLPGHLGEMWEELARDSVSRREIGGTRWRPAARWWGPGLDKRPLEIDIVALSEDGSKILIGEAKLRVAARDWQRIATELRFKGERFPLGRKQEFVPCIWYVEGTSAPRGISTVHARKVFS
jgi:hypothetical protein